MRKSQKLISMPILSITEGLQIGTVKSLVIDPERKEIAALIVDQKGWFREQKIIPFNKISNIGDDAITIDQSANVQKTTNLPEILKLMREKTELIGAKVFSESGKVLGLVDEYHIDEANGQIVALEVSGKFLDGFLKGRGLLSASQIKTIGTDAIVVTSRTEENISKIDGGFQETLSTFKDSTSSFWSSTREKTAEFSKTLKDKTKETREKIKTKTKNETNDSDIEKVTNNDKSATTNDEETPDNEYEEVSDNQFTEMEHEEVSDNQFTKMEHEEVSNNQFTEMEHEKIVSDSPEANEEDKNEQER